MTASASTPFSACEPIPARPNVHPNLREGASWLLCEYARKHPGYATLTVFFGALGFLLSFVYPWIIGSMIDLVVAGEGPPNERLRRLLWLTGLAATTGVLHAFVLYGRGHFNVHLGDSIIADLREALFRHLQRLSVEFHARGRTGALLSRVLHDVHEATAIIYQGVIVAVLDAAQLTVAFFLLFAISSKLTLACIGLFPLYGLVFALMNPRVRAASERLQEHFGQISATVSEQLSGQAVVKTFTAEEREAQRFSHQVRHHHRLVVDQSHAGHLVASCGEVLVHTGTTIVIGYGGWLALTGELTPGSLTRFLGYVVILYGPVRRFAELNVSYQSSLAAIRRVLQVLRIEPSIRELEHPRRDPPQDGWVRFQDVSFRYEQRSDELDACWDAPDIELTGATSALAVANVSLEAHPGAKLAIVGSSGAGKTTLLSLLPRLYDATTGRITIDGTDIREYSLEALRSAIGIVQQDCFLFTGSIRDNIAYGRPDASDAEVLEAARAAHAHEFIERLPNGYATLLGERGVNLSGGQRQRLSIARALLKAPRILILDEATSALDAESEHLVQNALETLMRGRTCFIIAHRLSTIRDADAIVVLEHGRVVEMGTHEELLRRRGAYQRLVAHQTLAA